MNISPKKTVRSDPSSCSESINFPSTQNDTNINYLLHVCYLEWVIIGILTMMIMVKMTDLEQEEWVWLKIFSGMLVIFSIPFTVGVHIHNDPSCDSEDHHPTKESDDKDDFKSAEDSEPEDESKKIEPSSKKKEPKFTLIKKPAKKTGKAELGKIENSTPTGSSSSSENGDSSAESSSSSTKVTRQKKRSKRMGKKNTARRTTKRTSSSKSRKSRKTAANKVSRPSSTSSSTSSSSTSSHTEGFHNAKAEVIIKKESAIESGEEDMAGVSTEEENDSKVESIAEGEANVTAEKDHGPDAGKESVKLDYEDDKDGMEVDTEKK